MDDKVLWQLSYGVYAVGVMDKDRPCGCIANAFMQVTAVNPIVALSMNKENYTSQVIRETKRFSISILSEQTNPMVISALGFASGKNRDKYQRIGFDLLAGLPVVKDNCCGYLICEVISVSDAQTHEVILARVVDAVMGVDATPMSYEYYHKVIKGKAPKNAPTYRHSETKKPVCEACGYVYEGTLESMPEDFHCPVCGAGKPVFKIKE